MTIDEFRNVDLRVAKVLAAERVEGSEKLLKLRVGLGTPSGDPAATQGIEERQLVAGIGKAYEPKTLVGKEIIMVVNLEPRMMMGLESQGMLLAASDADGKPVILTVETEVPPGTKIT